jgi:arylsulfatase A-like enzyme
MIMPHAELLVPEDSLFEKYLGRFPETPHVGGKGSEYGEDINIGAYCSQEHPRATFAAMVNRVDLYVGQILQTLEELGIGENTIVMFSSDNGPHVEGGADPGFFGSSGGLRGVKRDLYEGGIRVPFLVSWPGTVESGQVSEHVSAFWDIMPTLAALTGQSLEKTDGISFLPLLRGEDQPQHEYLYWEFHARGGRQAMIRDGWKAVRLNVGQDPDGPLELYRLDEDPAEENNLAGEYPDLAVSFAEAMEEARVPSPLFQWGKPVNP